MPASLSEQRGQQREQVAQGQQAQALKQTRAGKQSARDAYHYQDDYGAIMTDDQYKSNNEKQAAFQESIDTNRAGIVTAQGDLTKAQRDQQKAINDGRTDAYGKLNSAYSAGMSKIKGVNLGDRPNSGSIPTWEKWAAENTVTVGVDGHNYRMDKDSYNSFKQGVHDYNKNNEQDIGMWDTDTGVNIDTKGYGKEWHEMVGGYENKLKNKFGNEIAKAEAKVKAGQSSWDKAQKELGSSKKALELSRKTTGSQIDSAVNTANSALTGDVAIAQGKLNAASTSLDAAVTSRQTMLQGIKDRYKERLSKMRGGALQTKNKKGNS